MYTCGYPSVQSNLKGRAAAAPWRCHVGDVDVRSVALTISKCHAFRRAVARPRPGGGVRRPALAPARRCGHDGPRGERGGRCSAAARPPRPVVFTIKIGSEGRRPMDNGASAWAVRRRVAAGPCADRARTRRTGARRVPRGAPDWTAPTRPPSIDGKRADRTATVERPARHHNGMGTQYPAPHARHDARAGPRGQYRRRQEQETAAS